MVTHVLDWGDSLNRNHWGGKMDYHGGISNTPLTLSYVYHVVHVYLQWVRTSRRDRKISTNNLTNTITMVVDPLAPPAVWI